MLQHIPTVSRALVQSCRASLSAFSPRPVVVLPSFDLDSKLTSPLLLLFIFFHLSKTTLQPSKSSTPTSTAQTKLTILRPRTGGALPPPLPPSFLLSSSLGTLEAHQPLLTLTFSHRTLPAYTILLDKFHDGDAANNGMFLSFDVRCCFRTKTRRWEELDELTLIPPSCLIAAIRRLLQDHL